MPSVQWPKKVVSPEYVLERIHPGMSIFIGTGAAEPRTLVRHLMASGAGNLQDLELVQLVSFGDVVSLKRIQSQKFRLKTFFSGWVSDAAIAQGRVDLIPSRFSWVPRLIESGQIAIDVAFVQITPPDDNGNCSLGIAVDVARQAMDQAAMVVGEVNHDIPRTFGDTFVHLSDFDMLVDSSDPPIYFDRWAVDEVFDRVGKHVADLIPDGSCIAFSIGPLFESLGRHLAQRRDLGVHSPFFTDALMDLIESGAVSNRRKKIYRGKSLAAYALGTRDLMAWLDQNPFIEFQSIDKVFNPEQIGRNPGFMAVVPARKIDLYGRIALHRGKGNVATGPAEIMDFLNGADISDGGRTVFALASRNRKGAGNIRLSIQTMPNICRFTESVDMVVTEYGCARLKGLTLRERAQALIDIAHPEDRGTLVEQAKASHILFKDQVFHAESASLYPSDIEENHPFKGGVSIRFRGIKPSDEEEMRRLFYRFSDEAVYYRYFGHIRTMPHEKMQEYVNVDWRQVMSVVGLAEEGNRQRIIAEARYIWEAARPRAEVVFVVDEAYQGMGIGTYLYSLLIRLARERGVRLFTANVLFSNIGMMKVFKKGGLPLNARLDQGEYELTIPLFPES